MTGNLFEIQTIDLPREIWMNGRIPKKHLPQTLVGGREYGFTGRYTRKDMIFYINRDKIYIRDQGCHSKYELWAQLLEGEALYLSLYSRVDGVLHNDMHASLFYTAALKYFTSVHGSVESICGWWMAGKNWNEYLEAIKLGQSPHEAVWSTWSGKQARMHGYTEIRSFKLSSSEISVSFVRPKL